MRQNYRQQCKIFQEFLTNHHAINKFLKIDYPMCRILLKNKKLYSDFSLKRKKYEHARIWFRCYVIDKPFTAYFYNENEIKSTYSNEYCYGHSNLKGHFANEVNSMTHLSQFLATLPAFIARH